MTDPNKGLYVLLIENDPVEQERISKLLCTSLIKIQLIEKACTLNKAVELLRSTTFDLIFIDLSLSDSSGIDTFKQVKEFSQEAAIIILSAKSEIHAAAEAIRFGAQDCHIKEDLDAMQLTKTILKSIEAKQSHKSNYPETGSHSKGKSSAVGFGKSDELTRKIMDGALDAIICIDIKGKIIAWNLQAEKIFGWSQQEMMGKTLSETIIPVQYREAHERGISHYRSTGNGPILRRVIEITAIDSKGKEFPVELTIIPLGEKDKQFFCAFIRDISQRKASEKIIKDSEGKYRDFFENSLDGILLANPEGVIRAANPAACRMFGMTEAEICAAGRSGIVDPEDHRLSWIVEERKKTGKAKGELNFIRKGGSRFPAEISTSASIDTSGEEMTSIIIRDITDRKRNEDALIKSELHLRHVLSSSADNFYVIDRDCRITLINESAEKNLKKAWGVPVIVGTNILDVIPDEEEEPIRESLQKVFTGEKVEYELHLTTKDLPEWMLVNYMPVIDHDSVVIGAYIMSKDISERKRIEAGLKTSIERFETIAATTHDAIWEWNLETGKIWGNAQHQRLYGLTASDPVPDEKMWEQKIHPNDRKVILADLKKTLASDKDAWITEYRFLTSEGYKNIYDRSYIIRDEAKKPVRIMGSMMDITERKLIEDSLRESEERYRTLVEHAPEALVVFDMDTRKFVSVSRSAENLFKMSAEELVKTGPIELSPLHQPDGQLSSEAAMAYLADAMAGKESHFEWMHCDTDGNNIPCEIWLVRLPSDNSILIRGSITDISVRKKAEQALKESEEKYRNLIEQASDAIVIYSLDGRIVSCNNAFMNSTGYQPGDIAELKLSDLLFTEDLSTNPLKFDMVKKGIAVHDQRRARKKDGSEMPVELNSKMMPDGNVMVIARDITERKKAEELLLKEKELSDSIINSLPGLFYLIDERGNYIRWNKLKEEIGGYTAEEMSRMNSLDFFEGEEKNLVRQKITEGFLNGTTEVEAHIVTRTGERILYYFTGIAINYEGKNCLMGTGIDISHRKEAELELESSYKAIRQLTDHLQNIREEERAHIAREIHDELGQKLTVLKMDISWINKKLAIKEESVKARMKELLSMLDDTVKSVRRISSELRPSLLDDLGLTAAMEWHLNEFEKRVDIKTNFKSCEEFWLPEAMKTGLFRIFQESLTNVARHSKAKKVSVSLEKEDEAVILSVMDDGVGFDKEMAVSKKTLGILGMKERTSMIGGTYEIISKPGKGTRVVVTIPLSN